MLERLIHCGTALLADADMERINRLGRNFRGDHARLHLDKVAMIVAFFLSVGLVVWFVARIFDPNKPKKSFHNRRRLFKELCRSHHLSRQDKRLLRVLARQHRLADPTLLFLRPELFAVGATQTWLHGKADALESLRGRLFEGLAEYDAQPDPDAAVESTASLSADQ